MDLLSEWDEDTHKMLRCWEHGPYVPIYGRLGGTICPQCPNVFYDQAAAYQAALAEQISARETMLFLHPDDYRALTQKGLLK